MPGKSEVQENFEFAVKQVRDSDPNAKNAPSNETKLKFYGLYKQATEGPCNTSRPWAIQVVECAKWDAWNALGKMSKETAMLKYCELYAEHQ
ncbi:Acyl-CoA-binding protein [Yasminevirus sp. GU-2018]|uniref:Acyl-CoA-binding protein n=1 Tax=Yasminevirus sp. GU-2018 TaxID=2420051 RepID=A0A5K0U706_9VIRU|nr:Acyl-CoA-binding protein [Yasminevirus sp. GU-2018]